MKVSQLLENGFEAVTVTCGDREIDGVYIGDLLSWVMGRAQANNAWITIMSNMNVVAVASLTDVACVILAEEVTLSKEVEEAADRRSINVLRTKMSAYEAACVLHEMLS